MKVHEATNNVVRAEAVAKVRALVKLAAAVGDNVHARVLAEVLGHFHKNPHNDHKRELASAAMAEVLAAWRDSTQADKAIRQDAMRVAAAVTGASQALNEDHAIEWRVAREKRLNDAAAAKGADPVGGFEYCYTLAPTAAVLTSDENLPDPAWPFDKLATAPVVRGARTYTDGEPTPTVPLPWIVRFKRPIPDNTAAGADIGSVAWEQETAYQPAGG